MRRKGVGMGYVAKKQATDRSIAALAESVSAERMEALKKRLETFKAKLQEFAETHGAKIRQDPVFRHHFHVMCSKLGVDPLNSGKGFWAKTLGIGDFYYELAVQSAEVCLVTRCVNGGFIRLSELTERVKRKRPAHTRDEVSCDDVVCAIDKLQCLSAGYKPITIGKERWVRSVPVELSLDGMTVMALLNEQDAKPHATRDHLGKRLRWSSERLSFAVDDLLSNSLLWEDDVDKTVWSPSALKV
ncbi:Vacuolar protein sorting-associated protein 22-like protein 1 [Diplonema papillatum]|nr:Vacuolar protein sorting-associated protein 22-like protein 1 [Diplonema papillatum]